MSQEVEVHKHRRGKILSLEDNLDNSLETQESGNENVAPMKQIGNADVLKEKKKGKRERKRLYEGARRRDINSSGENYVAARNLAIDVKLYKELLEEMKSVGWLKFTESGIMFSENLLKQRGDKRRIESASNVTARGGCKAILSITLIRMNKSKKKQEHYKRRYKVLPVMLL